MLVWHAAPTALNGSRLICCSIEEDLTSNEPARRLKSGMVGPPHTSDAEDFVRDSHQGADFLPLPRTFRSQRPRSAWGQGLATPLAATMRRTLHSTIHFFNIKEREAFGASRRYRSFVCGPHTA